MRFWFFSEQQYHPGWSGVEGSIRVTIPASSVDPETAAALFDRYMDEFRLCDELGLDIMVNEHHSTMACMSVAPMVTLGAVARITRNARLLSLGSQIVNRSDPVRIAEEIALVDLFAHGRLEAGLVKGSTYELFTSNQNPVRLTERFWEAHDLIIKALSTRDGPFSWDSENFHIRHVNIVPPPYQRPHPPIWTVGANESTAREIARRGHVSAVFGMGTRSARLFFDAYRAEYLKVFGREASPDRFAHHAMTVVGATEREARERAEKLYEFNLAAWRVSSVHNLPPGYSSARETASALKAGRFPLADTVVKAATFQEYYESGKLIAGTPDQVAASIARIHDEEGGIGHFLMQGGGYLTFEDTADHLRLFADEVVPRLKKLLPNAPGRAGSQVYEAA